jgi:hypothetical protein
MITFVEEPCKPYEEDVGYASAEVAQLLWRVTQMDSESDHRVNMTGLAYLPSLVKRLQRERNFYLDPANFVGTIELCRVSTPRCGIQTDCGLCHAA